MLINFYKSVLQLITYRTRLWGTFLHPLSEKGRFLQRSQWCIRVSPGWQRESCRSFKSKINIYCKEDETTATHEYIAYYCAMLALHVGDGGYPGDGVRTRRPLLVSHFRLQQNLSQKLICTIFLYHKKSYLHCRPISKVSINNNTLYQTQIFIT